MDTLARTQKSNFLLAILQTQDQLLAQCSNVDQVYELMAYLAEQVSAVYPIGCFAGCAACCVASNTPNLSLVEWRKLFAHLQGLEPARRRAVVRRAAAFCGPRLDLIWELQQIIAAPPDMVRWQRLQVLMPELGGDADCVFLGSGGLCGVYEARPAKCRAHGNFILRYQDIVQMHSCEPEAGKFEQYMAQEGSRRLLMPLWNVFEKRLRELSAAGSIVTALPIWMLFHIDTGTGDLVPEVVEQPEWARLADPARRSAWSQALAALAPTPWSGQV